MSHQPNTKSGGRKEGPGLKPVATLRRSARVSKEKGPEVVSDSAGKGRAPEVGGVPHCCYSS